MVWHMSGWLVAITVYVSLAVLTGLPIIRVLISGIPLNPGGTSFQDSPNFSEPAPLNSVLLSVDGHAGFLEKTSRTV